MFTGTLLTKQKNLSPLIRVQFQPVTTITAANDCTHSRYIMWIFLDKLYNNRFYSSHPKTYMFCYSTRNLSRKLFHDDNNKKTALEKTTLIVYEQIISWCRKLLKEYQNEKR